MNTKPFVIFGAARTGSTLLKSLLTAHPSIHCDGELFNFTGSPRVSRPQFLKRYLRGHPRLYISANRVRACLRFGKPVYGFKLFERQVDAPERLLRALSNEGWRILFISRRSEFDRTLSVVVGKATSHWISRGESPECPGRIFIDPAEFLLKARFIHDQQIRIAAIARSLPHLGIVYEDDLRHEKCWQPVMNRISDYLDLPRCVAAAETRPTWREAYKDIVVNYDELTESFLEESGMANRISVE